MRPFPDQVLDGREGNVGLGPVGTASLGHVRTPATTLAARRLGTGTNQFDRTEASSQIFGDADDDSELAVRAAVGDRESDFL